MRKARPCARPNAGFVAALKAWEQQVLARPPDAPPEVPPNRFREAAAATQPTTAKAELLRSHAFALILEETLVPV